MLALFFSVSAGAARLDPADRKDQSEARQVLELVLERNYPEAEATLTRLLEERPEDLLGYFGRMAYSQIRNLENFDFRFEPLYARSAREGRERALKVTRYPAATAWELTLAGGILGVSGFQKAHHGKWLAALWDAQTAVRALSRAHQKDPKGGDPLLGLGLYHYWRSYYTRVLRMLPFFPDRREEGRREMRRAGEEGQFVGPAAAISLAFVDFHAKRYAEVLQTTGHLLQRYPNNIIVRMLLGQTCLEMKKYPEARIHFGEIRKIDPALTKADLWLGLTYVREGSREPARTHLNRYLLADKNAPKHWRKLAEGALQKLAN